MSETATHAISLLEIIAIIFGFLLVIMQLTLRLENYDIKSSLKRSIFKNTVQAMSFLLIAVIVIVVILFQEIDPRLGFASGIIMFSLIFISVSSIQVLRSID